ncbi:hypothetical protein GJR96_07075 [Haloferax sp. MBLA0076]|uniref:DUF7344 domain-containing protein n=1 Tax=Haloferax litoreum TaxID=2666140 RepID=A0A6A8GHW6_9EURY|nr:hypothetical protein Hfx1148_07070 [Haloferax sp. CBA1148]MRX21717.1 hypothetical protein [Haloferax litoreum]
MTEEPIDFSSVLSLCQNQHRRIVLAVLTEEHRSFTLNDLTKTVLTYNHQTTSTEASEDAMTKVRLSLHHVHLPKLASGGLITYDPERQFVEPTELLDQMQPTLSTILGADPSLDAPMELYD